MKYPLAPSGIFWTLQGEGALQGEPMAFVRLAGCSVGCLGCDTDYRVDRRLTVEEIVAEIRAVVPPGFQRPWVWLTGGEPTDHDLKPLVDLLRTIGFRVALATAGVRNVDLRDFNWISISAHRREFPLRHGHEIKLVPELNGLSWEDVNAISASHVLPYRFIQPMWYQTVNGPEQDGAASRASLERCIAFVKTHPGWRLTIQAHKYWQIP